jgi:hypothetical protein
MTATSTVAIAAAKIVFSSIRSAFFIASTINSTELDSFNFKKMASLSCLVIPFSNKPSNRSAAVLSFLLKPSLAIIKVLYSSSSKSFLGSKASSSYNSLIISLITIIV